MLDLPDETNKNYSTKKAMTKKIYEKKCAYPGMKDMLNFIYELQFHHNNFASALCKKWNTEDTVFGAEIRERIKNDFLEVSEIEALERVQNYEESSSQKNGRTKSIRKMM